MMTPRFLPAVLLASILLMPGAAAAQVTWDWWPGPTPPEALEKLMPNPHQWPTEQQLKAVEELVPEKPVVAPARPRRVLVWGRLWTHGSHASTVLFQETMKMLGRKTGAFEAVGSDDPLLLLPEKLKDFDAIFWNSLHDPAPFLPQNWQELPEEKQAAARKLDAAVKESILRFVMEDGKGRVFYVAIGYSRSDYLDPIFLRHLLAATQFLVGDLPADATPSGPKKAPRTD
jgi:hypothetical protein